MALVQTTYYHIECNGPAATPFQAHCNTTADGGWNQEDVEAAAVADGWAQTGRSWFCRKHAPATTASSGGRAPRAKAETASE